MIAAQALDVDRSQNVPMVPLHIDVAPIRFRQPQQREWEAERAERGVGAAAHAR